MRLIETKYLPLLATTGVRYGLSPEFLVAIAYIESSFNPDAQVHFGPDEARGGAYGLCQLTLKTARALGFKGEPSGLLYPDTNAEYAAILAAQNAKRLGTFAILDLAAAHNSGKSYAHAPHVSQEYAQKVSSLCDIYHDSCAQYAKKTNI
jgi:soluble lytic murein transglycosylase-like protein